MSVDATHPDLSLSQRDLLRYELLSPLTVISVRSEFLQRITQQTPGLNDLERTALLQGLADIVAAAQQLVVRLEPLIRRDAPTGALLPTEVPR